MIDNCWRIFWVFCFFLIGTIQFVCAKPLWLKLPPTPNLPKAKQSGFATVNGIRLWYASYGYGQPVILLHGGLANSNYWGNQVPVLAKYYRVIVMDSRGHGKSTHNRQPFSYELMSSDVIGLMNFLKIKKSAIIGWSDGAIIGLDIAIRHPERVTKLFAYAANSNPNGVKGDILNSPVFKAYVSRTEKEYEKLSSTPKSYKVLFNELSKMSAAQPNFTKEQLKSIQVPVWIVDGDHDEVVKRENSEFMAEAIPKAGLLIQPWVSHFSFLQDPQQFNKDALYFLENS